MELSVGVGAVMETADVSAFPPPVAITRYVPAVEPAVNQPEELTVPPVAVQVIVGSAVLPSLQVAATANCWLAPAASETGFGVTARDVRVRTFTVTAEVSAKPPLAAMTR
jgi:hypothetical protein